MSTHFSQYLNYTVSLQSRVLLPSLLLKVGEWSIKYPHKKVSEGGKHRSKNRSIAYVIPLSYFQKVLPTSLFLRV